MAQLVFTVLLVLFGSALCSGTEAAILSIPLLKARQIAQSRKPAALALMEIREKVNRPIAAIVILNNLFNIVGSIVIGRIAADLFGEVLLGVFSAILTFLIILFAEILPKTLGERYAENIGLIIAIPIRALTWLLLPVILLLEKLTAPLVQGDRRPVTDEAEIKLLAMLGYQEGMIEDDEAEMIQKVFRLNDMTAADIMTPRVAITYLEAADGLAAVKDVIIKSQHSRMIVVGEDIDHILGVALKAELLAAIVEEQGNATVQNVMREAHYIPETVRADKLLKTFQTSREHLMIVVDEYGGVLGVVTLEDVLEVLTGEIVDETDRNVDLQALARQRRRRLLKTHGFLSQN
ncbi:HlyC/CorC family transporter [filamentous cyanobacterium LEGE 11480]|uniref:HlyC/CorC family transporter n=1 Tax=Romeriopsis navalis LEGE 11480 TaxID=2777977 RepID=A0A928VP99_9CYAN|nr:hemolysin family protein [Romeriopsis navalis]MBE9032278.1 HlyC/CorC family transporter [Romeriopsis navalis LEGE 11480]